MPRAESPALRRRALESRIDAYAKAHGTTVTRAHRLVGFSIVCGVLSNAVQAGILPFYLVKGGVAIELRLGLTARATKDLDIGLGADPEKLLSTLDTALAQPYGDFTARRRGEDQLENGAYRVRVVLTYLGRAFSTVDVDLVRAEPDAATEAVRALSLQELGIENLPPVPCLALWEQVAQKLHALTEPLPRGRVNGRFRDVIDVLMLRSYVDPSAVAEASTRIFAERGTHPWPVVGFRFPLEWAAPLSALAFEVGYGTTRIEELYAEFSLYLELIGRRG